MSPLSAFESPKIDNLDHLSRSDFDRLAVFIEQYSGIKMPAVKITMVEGRLRRRVRATGHVNLKQYCDTLFRQGGLQAEAVHLIDAVTTNKTDFFREPDHFRFMVDHVVPQFMAAGGRQAGATLKIWSAACSIGAEPYTLAMVLADIAKRVQGLRFAITATDICTEVLQTAIGGIYPEAMMAPVPAELRKCFIARSKDRSRQVVRVVPELRAMVKFGRVNLVELPYHVERDMDVVFCRNILIYFQKDIQEMVLARLAEHLRPGGHLFLGHAETLTGFDLPLEAVGPTVFRRI